MSKAVVDVPRVRCRLCLSTDPLQVGIFGPYGRRHKLADKIGVLLPVGISRNDKLSQTVCHQCVARLNEYCDYYSYSLTTERLLNGERWPLRRNRTKNHNPVASAARRNRRAAIAAAPEPVMAPPPPPAPAPKEVSPTKQPSVTASEENLLTQSPKLQLLNDTFVVSPKKGPPEPSLSFLDMKNSHRKKKSKPSKVYSTYNVSQPLFD